MVDRRRLLDALQQDRRRVAHQVEVDEHDHLTVHPRAGAELARRTTARPASASIDGPRARRPSGRDGPRPRRGAHCVRRPASSETVAPAARPAKARGRGPLARPLGSDEQVGVDGRAHRGPQLGDGPVLADDVIPQCSTASRTGCRRWSRRPPESAGRSEAAGHDHPTRGPATSRTEPSPSTTTHRCGSAAAWCAEPGVDPLVERRARPPRCDRWRRRVARRRLGVGTVEQHDQVGPEPIDRPERDPARPRRDRARGRSPGRRSTNRRSDRRPRRGRSSSAGSDQLGDVVGPIGGHQQRLGPIGDHSSRLGRARWRGSARRRRSRPVGGSARRRAASARKSAWVDLPRALTALEHDEPTRLTAVGLVGRGLVGPVEHGGLVRNRIVRRCPNVDERVPVRSRVGVTNRYRRARRTGADRDGRTTDGVAEQPGPPASIVSSASSAWDVGWLDRDEAWPFPSRSRPRRPSRIPERRQTRIDRPDSTPARSP